MTNVDFPVMRGKKKAEMLAGTIAFLSKFFAFNYLQCTLQLCLQFKVGSVNPN